MSGNLWEWCIDSHSECYGQRGDITLDPIVHLEQRSYYSVLRGGCWSDPPTRCRVAYRYKARFKYRFCVFGLRLSRSIDARSIIQHTL